MKIIISADSTCSISQKEAKELGIYILPLNVIVDGCEYHDDITINQTKLKDMMRNGSKIQTSTPTPYEIETYFDNIFAQGYDKIIHFTISSKLSSMFSLFTIICKEKYGDKIEVIDSLSVCSIMGNLVKNANNLKNKGLKFNDILNKITNMINVGEIYFVPESLTFLKNGGRISTSVAIIGNMLGIKPLLKFANGEICKNDMVRTYKKAFNNIVEIIKNKNINSYDYEIHIFIFDSDKYTTEILDILKKEFKDYIIKINPISINVCAHCGPGTIGVGYCRAEV